MELHTAGSLQRVHGIALEPGRQGWRDICRSLLNAAAQIAAPVTAMVAAWRRSLREDKAIATLSEMDDRMLADIGLTRSEIPEAVRCKGRWQHTTPDQPGRGR